MNLPIAFNEFHERIQLGAIPEGRMASAWDGLQPYLLTELSLPEEAVFLQGSYANNTAVRPPTPGREYDLDVVVVGFDEDESATAALERLETVLKRNGDYKSRIHQKGPCVRLAYAADDEGHFHVDVVPARKGQSAPIQVPRRNEGWHDSDPQAYTRWCRDQRPQFSRTVRVLKRWRDVQQSDQRKVKSIVLQVLIGRFYGEITEDAESIVLVLSEIARWLREAQDSVTDLANPVLPSENLTARWPLTDFRDFQGQVSEAVALATAALAESNPSESHRLWRHLFGDDFPREPGGGPAMPRTPPPGHEKQPQSPPQDEHYA